MSLSPNRLATLKMLAGASPACNAPPGNRPILNELEALFETRAVRDRRRRWLLEALHATRALDSALRAITAHYGCTVQSPGLGPYLKALTGHPHPTLRRLPTHHHGRYKKGLVKRRNQLMHAADSYPTNAADAEWILAEMESCFALVLGLE